MDIDIIDDDHQLNNNQLNLIEDVIKLSAQMLSLSDVIEVDISIVDNDTIQTLNRTYRQIDRPTDVLSFALEENLSDAPSYDYDSFSNQNDNLDLPRHLGDIIISYPRAMEQAEEYQHSFERELAFLAVHGFLHLNGFDHQTPDQEKEMFELQEKILQTYGLGRD